MSYEIEAAKNSRNNKATKTYKVSLRVCNRKQQQCCVY